MTNTQTFMGDLFDFTSRLPKQPFLGNGWQFQFCQFERFRAGSFGKYLSSLSNESGDRTIDVVAVDSPPQQRNVHSIAASSVATGFGELLAFEPNGDVTEALLYTVETLAVTGSSKAWGVWGERDKGIAIIGTRQGLTVTPTPDFFVSVEEAWRDFVGSENPSLGSNDFAQKAFMANFGGPKRW